MIEVSRRQSEPVVTGPLLRILPRGGAGVERVRLDDGAEHAAASQHVAVRTSFDVEDQEAALVLHKAGGGAHGRALRHGFQVINFNSRADGDCTGRELRLHSLCGSDFHHADHRRSGEYGGEPRVVCGDGPFVGDYAFDRGFQTDARHIFVCGV